MYTIMQKMRIPCRRMRAIVILGVVLLQASAKNTTSDDVAVDFLVLAPYPDIAANPGCYAYIGSVEI